MIFINTLNNFVMDSWFRVSSFYNLITSEMQMNLLFVWREYNNFFLNSRELIIIFMIIDSWNHMMSRGFSCIFRLNLVLYRCKVSNHTLIDCFFVVVRRSSRPVVLRIVVLIVVLMLDFVCEYGSMLFRNILDCIMVYNWLVVNHRLSIVLQVIRILFDTIELCVVKVF